MAAPKDGRPVDADLKFYGAVMKSVASPRGVMEAVRTNFYFVIVVLTVLYSGWCFWDRFKGANPSTIHRVFPLNSPVPRGGILNVQFDLMRNRICERDYEMILADHTGHRDRITQAHMHGIGNPGPDSYVERIRLPDDLEPGAARFRIIWSWQCPENIFETIYPKVYISPEINFEISPAP